MYIAALTKDEMNKMISEFIVVENLQHQQQHQSTNAFFFCLTNWSLKHSWSCRSFHWIAISNWKQVCDYHVNYIDVRGKSFLSCTLFPCTATHPPPSRYLSSSPIFSTYRHYNCWNSFSYYFFLSFWRVTLYTTCWIQYWFHERSAYFFLQTYSPTRACMCVCYTLTMMNAILIISYHFKWFIRC